MNKQGNVLLVIGITILVIIGIMVVIGLWIAGTYNSFVNTDTSVEKSWGNVQTSYQRRADLIPNLVETVKGISNFEKDTQTQIAAFRSGIASAKTPGDLDKVGTQMNSLISNLIVSVEAYPNLKSNENFLALQDELAGTENRINWERNNYNEQVQVYKKKVRSFPGNVIAGMFGFESTKWDMFNADENASKAPKVSFGK